MATMKVQSPYSGEELGDVELADGKAIETVLDKQVRVFKGGSLPRHERIAILKRTAGLMGGKTEELALTIAREGGKPLADARIEVARAINGIELLAEEAGRVAGEEIPMGATAPSTGRLAFTTRQPIGIVAAVSAFNHPLNLIVHQAGPAIAAGCPVIVKPASTTPLSCLSLMSLFHEAGLPEEWGVALPMRGATAEQLVTSDRIAFFSFIGSGKVGWSLRSKLAPGVRCGLEHGGVAPVIVDESADLEKTVPSLLKGGFYHAGQVCVSVQRLFVHNSRKNELIERLTAGIKELVTGDPTKAETEVGPLIQAGEVTRVDEWVQEAINGGATATVGAKALENQCYAPTLLVEPPADSRVMTSEIFGPVVCVAGFDAIDDAIERANGLPFAFQAAVISQDIDRAFYAAQRIDAAAVMINDHTAFRVDWMPFGGWKASGLGLGGMPYTMRDVTHEKLLVINAGAHA